MKSQHVSLGTNIGAGPEQRRVIGSSPDSGTDGALAVRHVAPAWPSAGIAVPGPGFDAHRLDASCARDLRFLLAVLSPDGAALVFPLWSADHV